MKAKRIQHVAVAVSDLNGAVGALSKLGLTVAHEEVMDQYGVQLALLPIGESALELVQPFRDGTRTGRWIEERGEGLYHICLEVDDIDEALRDLKERGVLLLDEIPRSGHHGSRIAFIDPAVTANVLIELVELSSTSDS